MPAALVNSEYATMFVAAVVIGLVMSKRTVRIGVGLVLGGMVSNWLSLAFGMHAIVDFIGVFRGQLVFNVADMSIVAGVVIILSGTLLSVRQRVTGVIPSKDRSGSVWLVPPGKREESPAIVKMPGTLWVLLGERGGECQHSTEGCTDC
jgi:hypothetical protein